MTIGVVIASFGYGHLAAHAIESVLAQTRKPDQVLFVDDGKGDCGNLPGLYPEVEFLLRPVNYGVVANFNDILFNHVRTDRVMFIGADNWLDRLALESLEVSDADVVSYGWRLEGDCADAFPTVHRPLHGSSLYDARKAKLCGGYSRSDNEHAEEDSMLFRRMRKDGCSFRHLPVELLHYRRHRTNGNKP